MAHSNRKKIALLEALQHQIQANPTQVKSKDLLQ
jgi:hypothetical protein